MLRLSVFFCVNNKDKHQPLKRWLKKSRQQKQEKWIDSINKWIQVICEFQNNSNIC